MHFGTHFGSVAEKIEGGMKITRPDGVTMIMHDGGGVTIENLIPKSVGIRDVSEIESFAVRTVEQTRICRIDFFGGGHVEIAYSQDGQVMGVNGQNLKQTITKDDEVIVSQGDSASGQMH